MKPTTGDSIRQAALAAPLAAVILFCSGAPGHYDITAYGVAGSVVAGCVFLIRSTEGRQARLVWGFLAALGLLLLVQRWLEVRNGGLEQLLFLGLGLPRLFALWTTLALPIYISGLINARRRGVAYQGPWFSVVAWLVLVAINRLPATAASDVAPWPVGNPWIGALYLAVVLPFSTAIVFFALKRRVFEEIS